MPKRNSDVTGENPSKPFTEEQSMAEIVIGVPFETMEVLREIAAKRKLSVESVVKFLIGKGLRDIEPELSGKAAIARIKNRKPIGDSVEMDLVA